MVKCKTLTEQVRALNNGETTSVALVENALHLAEKYAVLNAFVALDKDIALKQAQQSDNRRKQGILLGDLDGVPIAVKDNYLTKDYPTTSCSEARPLESSQVDATIVANLRTQGAVIFGKTNMHEWAYGATNSTSCFGVTRNPHNTDHITGGSSGGSGAAVASGIVRGALGSDTGGSVRIPSAACGIYGLKPTYGRASRYGVLPLSWSLDAPGPMASSLDDIELILPCFLGRDDKDKSTHTAQPYISQQSPDSIRILNLVGEGLERSEEVDSALTEAFQRIDMPRKDIVLKYMQSYFSAWETILHCEASAYHQPLLQQQVDKFSEVTLTHLLAGMELTGVELLNAQSIRAKFTNYLLNEIGEWDILVLPTLPVTAPKHGDDYQEFGGVRVTTQDSMTWFCWPGNLAGLPCLSIPITKSKIGLPISIMLMGRPNQDEKLIAMGKELELRGLSAYIA